MMIKAFSSKKNEIAFRTVGFGVLFPIFTTSQLILAVATDKAFDMVVLVVHGDHVASKEWLLACGTDQVRVLIVVLLAIELSIGSWEECDAEWCSAEVAAKVCGMPLLAASREDIPFENLLTTICAHFSKFLLSTVITIRKAIRTFTNNQSRRRKISSTNLARKVFLVPGKIKSD